MSSSSSVAPTRRVLSFAVAIFLVLAMVAIGWHALAKDSVGTDQSSTSETGNSGEDILLGLAKAATIEHHLVAPAGNNAYEFYLSAQQLDTKNAVVHEHMSALFEDACADVEKTINARDVDEAQRELSLLRDYDSDNYKLALLGSKLSAQRMVLTREHEAQAAAIRAQAERAPL